jgi:hypothetical protein
MVIVVSASTPMVCSLKNLQMDNYTINSWIEEMYIWSTWEVQPHLHLNI